jgi:hypothetical protein
VSGSPASSARPDALICLPSVVVTYFHFEKKTWLVYFHQGFNLNFLAWVHACNRWMRQTIILPHRNLVTQFSDQQYICGYVELVLLQYFDDKPIKIYKYTRYTNVMPILHPCYRHRTSPKTWSWV